jgi:hypothetical protein
MTAALIFHQDLIGVVGGPIEGNLPQKWVVEQSIGA